MKTLIQNSLFGLLVALAPAAHASLILAPPPNPIASTGNGLGSALTLLTVQSPGDLTVESGCVAPTSGGGLAESCAANATFGSPAYADFTTKSGNSQLNTALVAQGSSASGLQFIFNATEPSGNGLLLDAFSVYFYRTGSTTPIFIANTAGPIILNNTLSGIGNAGFIFQLDTAQASTVQGLLGTGSLVIGAGFEAGCGTGSHGGTTVTGGACNGTNGTTGGQEIVQIQGTGVSASVPEPASMLLMGAGLLGLGLLRKRIRA